METNEPGRDRFDGLRCPKLGCKTVIYALTGLQELVKLQQHLRGKHREPTDMRRALEIRARAEKSGKDA